MYYLKLIHMTDCFCIQVPALLFFFLIKLSCYPLLDPEATANAVSSSRLLSLNRNLKKQSTFGRAQNWLCLLWAFWSECEPNYLSAHFSADVERRLFPESLAAAPLLVCSMTSVCCWSGAAFTMLCAEGVPEFWAAEEKETQSSFANSRDLISYRGMWFFFSTLNCML